MKAVLNKPVIPQGTVDLIGLTFEEAKTLLAIMSKIGGSPDKSRRKHTDRIHASLCEVISYDPVKSVKTPYNLYFCDEEGI